MTKLSPSPSPLPLTARAFADRLIASTLTSFFHENGTVMLDAIAYQAQRLAQIDGIVGIAINTTVREREFLSRAECPLTTAPISSRGSTWGWRGNAPTPFPFSNILSSTGWLPRILIT